MNEFTVRLALAKGKARQQQTVFVRQGDMNATTIVATITDHGAAAATSGMTARFAMRLPNGTEYYRKAASLSGNVATVTLDEAQAASVAGRTDTAYFQLLQGSTVVASTESFTVVVLPDALADAEVAESYDSAIQDAIDALDAAVEQMPDMVEDVLEAHPEWTTTVQDGSITASKLATDLARDRERLMYRLANMLTATLPEGETATATDAAKTPVAGLALYGRSTQDGTPTPSAPVAIQSVEAPNLLQNVASTTTVNGITYTVNADGSVTANGTATANAQLLINMFVPADGTYSVSGCPAGGSSSTYAVRAYANNGGTYKAQDVGSSATFSFTASTDVNLGIYIFVFRNATVSNLTFGPMVARGTTAIAKFVPYGNVGLWAKRTSDASTYTVTPIDLQGHELRSLPDGTRDEVTVDEYGHAVLVQKVGVKTYDGSSSQFSYRDDVSTSSYAAFKTSSGNRFTGVQAVWGAAPLNGVSTAMVPNSTLAWNATGSGFAIDANADVFISVPKSVASSVAELDAYLQAHPLTLQAALATPVTHDLGYVAAVPLVGPDLTAQAVPTAPMQLTYERDLNVTLARLESAIATLA